MLNPNVGDEIMKPIKNGEMRLVGTTSNGICMYVCMYVCMHASLYLCTLLRYIMYLCICMQACMHVDRTNHIIYNHIIDIPGTQMSLVLIAVWAFFWRVEAQQWVPNRFQVYIR